MNYSSLTLQFAQNALVLLIAPLLYGWINQCRARMQSRSGAGVLQPYRNLIKLFRKDAVLAHDASALFRYTIDSAYGDRNLVCSCPPIEMYAGTT